MLWCAFYKAEKGDTFDKLINVFSKGYSHVELVLSKPGKDSLCFSSSPRDGGVRLKQIDLTDGKWVVLPVRFSTKRDETEAITFAQVVAKAGAPYDWGGILHFAFGPLFKQKDSEWFCSEVVSAALIAGGRKLPKLPYDTSPVDLYKYLGGK